MSNVPSLMAVADLAGVSSATVSRAFNAPHLLKPATLQRVNAAAERLKYFPDGLARSLRSNRSKVIGAVMPSLRHAYFATTVEGLQVAISKEGYTLLLATSDFDLQKELTAVRSMVRQGVDGIVLVGRQHHLELLPMLEERKKPFMITWSYDQALPSVGFDHQRAGQVVANHILDLGHRDIVVIMAFLTVSDRERDRLAGIEQALAARGVALSGDRVVYASGSGLQDGRNALRAALSKHRSATAVICANDLLASGALLECSARGLRVPQDISITGYGDLEIAAAMNPPLTTLRTRAEDMGRIAAQCLLARLADQNVADHIELATELIVRESTGPAKSFPA